MIHRRNLLAGSAAAAGLSLAGLVRNVLAQGLGKPATIFVGFPAGGSSDYVTRLTAEKISGKYASPVLVDNKAGAGARIATEYVKARAPDGTSILCAPSIVVSLYPHVYKRLSYDPFADLTPVTRITKFPIGLFAGSALPESIKTLADLGPWLKADQKRALYGSPGAGASPHFAGDMIMRALGVSATPVQYRGGAPGVQDLLGGQIALYVGAVGDPYPHVKAGKLRCLVTTGPTRSPFFPDVPTMSELGHKDIVVEDAFAFYLPGKASAETVDRLYRPVAEALKHKDVIDGFARMGFEPAGDTPEAFAQLLRTEHESWRRVVAASGFKPEE